MLLIEMFKKLLNLKAVVLALSVAIAYCLFTGICWNGTKPYKSEFNQSHWYYLSRGGPQAWSGVSLESLNVPFPIIKAPFLVYGGKFRKIIDLGRLAPVLLTVFLIAYVFSFLIIKGTKKIIKKSEILYLIYIPLQLFLLMASIYLYFNWFPRI